MRTLTPDDVAALPRPTRKPDPRRLHRELAGLVQPLRLGLNVPRLALVPRGDGRPVLTLPGWRAGEASMAPIGTYLRWLGHLVEPWGLGVNTGDVRGHVRAMLGRVEEVSDAQGEAVALVGWSLGGTIAREVARRSPDRVRLVVTFGTPVIGVPAFTLPAEERGEEWVAERLQRQREAELADPIRVPVTTIFTRRDRVVAWPACIDHITPGVEHVEVRSTHLSLGVDPDVWRTVADRLAATT